jgi:hypothetical protein
MVIPPPAKSTGGAEKERRSLFYPDFSGLALRAHGPRCGSVANQGRKSGINLGRGACVRDKNALPDLACDGLRILSV